MKLIRYATGLALAMALIPAVALAAGSPSPTETPRAGVCTPLPAATEVRFGELSHIGGYVTVPATQLLQGSVSVLGGDVRIDGVVGGSVSAAGGNVILGPGAQVKGSLSLLGGDITMAPCSHVAGAISLAGGDLRRDPSAIVDGAVSVAAGNWARGLSVGQWGWSGSHFPDGFTLLGDLLFSLFGLGAVALLAVLIVPRQLQAVETTAGERPWESVAVGCLSIPALVVLAIALTITIIGIPVALLMLVAVPVAWLFGLAAMSTRVGRELTRLSGRSLPSALVATLLGVATLVLLSLVPFVGWLMVWVVSLIGFGALVLSRGGTRAPRPPVEVIPPTV